MRPGLTKKWNLQLIYFQLQNKGIHILYLLLKMIIWHIGMLNFNFQIKSFVSIKNLILFFEILNTSMLQPVWRAWRFQLNIYREISRSARNDRFLVLFKRAETAILKQESPPLPSSWSRNKMSSRVLHEQNEGSP